MNGGRFLFPFCTVLLPIRLHCEGVCVCALGGGGVLSGLHSDRRTMEHNGAQCEKAAAPA